MGLIEKTGYRNHGRRHAAWGTDPLPRRAEYEFKIFDDTTVVTTGDGKLLWRIPRSVDGLRLYEAHIYVSTVSSSGKPTLQIANITQATDVLTTKAEIDVSEYRSEDAATQPVSDRTIVFAAGDRISFDVDIAGTGAKGLGGTLVFTPLT